MIRLSISTRLHGATLQKAVIFKNKGGSVTNILYAFLISPMRVTCPAHIFLLDFISIIYIRNSETNLLLYLFIRMENKID
jgi:hypothetical protein